MTSHRLKRRIQIMYSTTIRESGGKPLYSSTQNDPGKARDIALMMLIAQCSHISLATAPVRCRGIPGE
jgi:hypothetical protein